ncbi:AraC family transcriptional regulator [Aquimarina sp. D1M17]|uniref:helix-turn-helix domain-containing protein n=1 Tax=Aquimarina acroporae TaxID=2937283 RepID=UPI0020C03510|nr:AraC family transcriptional regulator [Aquimarina acroporae]MCK8520095.1 AraC family transcriptional regulator [Aquimarina acroporae]
MSKKGIIEIKSISQFFNALGWKKPNHPLIGVIDVTRLEQLSEEKKKAFEGVKMTSDLYSIILKDGDCGMQYGRNKYDFEEGVLRFIGPNQIVSSTTHTPSSYGFMLVFHPDLLRNFNLGNMINSYGFFNYSVHEALHLSKKEEDTLTEIAHNIKTELDSNIDNHTQEVIVTNLELLLNYSKRFYNRQFITRTNSSPDVITKVETLIKEYYQKNLQVEYGTPTPEYFAKKVNFSTNYLSDLLKKDTGKSTKDLVDDHIVDLAKTQLLNSEFTINEIAYNLGFNYPHYFSRMFKKKVGESPREFRSKTFN